MTRTKRWWRQAAALAMGSAVVAGCQQFAWVRTRPLLAPDNAEAGFKVSAQQAADVQVALGRSLEKRGNMEQARAAYEEAIKRDPHRTDAYWRLAILNDREGRFQESAALYRKALRTSPGNPDIYCDMGYSLYLQCRWAEAEMNLKQALALKPDLARAHNNLGLVQAHTERFGQALAEFRKAGSEADAHVNLALALLLDRRWEEAQKHYQLALTANPSSEAARNGLNQLNTLLAKTSSTSARTPQPEIVAAGATVPAPAAWPNRGAAADHSVQAQDQEDSPENAPPRRRRLFQWFGRLSD
jgi:Flp pilus assembly protein TadD